MHLAPILLFVYNRPLHTKQTVEALLQNNMAQQSDLIIYSDGAKEIGSSEGVTAVRTYLKEIKGFKSTTIIERESNRGLANNIIEGVTETVNRYGKVIVLEDDLVTSPHFLQYMNNALYLYQEEEKVISIHAYIYPTNRTLPDTFFIKGADCWGWATWKRGWDLFNHNANDLLHQIETNNLNHAFDFSGSYPYTKMLRKQLNGKINSWAIRWYASAFLNNKLTLYPRQSLVKQIGTDGSGTHCPSSVVFNVELLNTPLPINPIEIEELKEGREAFIHFFRYTMKYRKVISKIKSVFSSL